MEAEAQGFWPLFCHGLGTRGKKALYCFWRTGAEFVSVPSGRGLHSAYMCRIPFFSPIFYFIYFLLKTAILRIEEASAWQLWQLCCVLPLRCRLHTVVQVTQKDNQVLQPVNWKGSDWSACSLCIFALLEYRQWSDRGEVGRSVQKYELLSAHSCRLRDLDVCQLLQRPFGLPMELKLEG